MSDELEVTPTPAEPSDDESPEALAALREQVVAAEAQRLAAEKTLEDLRTKIREAAVSHALWQASAGRVEYPVLVNRLIDPAMVQFDSVTGEVTGAKEAVEEILARNPKLAHRPQKGGGSPQAMRFKEPKNSNGTPPPRSLPDLRGHEFM